MVFNPAPFHRVRNDELGLPFLVPCGFIGTWQMPLLLLLAGRSASCSVGSRAIGGFARERFSKLAVPLVGGCLVRLGVAISGGCFVVAIAGFAGERMRAPGPGLPCLREAALPVYILRQPAVVLLGCGVVQLPLQILVKFTRLLATSVVATLAVRQAMVRPIPLPRLALGMGGQQDGAEERTRACHLPVQSFVVFSPEKK